MRPMLRRTLPLILVAVALLACKKLGKKDPYETVQLAEMKSAHRANRASAEGQYTGKFLRTTGVVTSTLDTDTAKWIFINTSQNPEGDILDKLHVICQLKMAGQLAHGVKGLTLTVHAYNMGPHPFSKNFRFEDCVVEGKPDSDAADRLPGKHALPE